MVTIIAPAMGIAVRFTRSKEETPPIPEDTTITAPPFLISWIFGTILGLISRKGIFISKNSPFSAKN